MADEESKDAPKVETDESEGVPTITVDGRDLVLEEPRGRNGRRATNFLLGFASKGGDESSIDELLKLTVDEEFLDTHMKAFFSQEDAKFVDDRATTGELLNMVIKVITEVFEAFDTPEVDAALKNLPGAQEGEGE